MREGCNKHSELKAAPMLEKQIEQRVIKWAIERGALCLKLNLTGNTGWPDRLFCHEGRVCFIEFKRPGGKLERNQPERVLELRKRKFKVGVFDNEADAIAFLEATLFSA
jgi:hypothetical protein